MARPYWGTPQRALIWSATAALLVVPGCSSDEESASEPGTTSAPTSPTSEPESAMPDETSPTGSPPTSGGLPVGEVSEEVRSRASVQAAMQDLADRTGVELADIAIVGYAEVTWPDGSLGCPQPGRMYSQALVPGEQLVLRVSRGSQAATTGPGAPHGLVSYHAGRGGTFTWCPNPRPPLPAGAGST